jgi:hypothetical protein
MRERGIIKKLIGKEEIIGKLEGIATSIHLYPILFSSLSSSLSLLYLSIYLSIF